MCDTNNTNALIPILSLIVAVLAVFVAPIVTFLVSRRQLRIANKQITAPMRQEWINQLRKTISELTAKSSHYWAAGYEEREDSEYLHITHLLHDLELQLNPNEELHNELLKQARLMESRIGCSRNKEDDEKFYEAHRGTVELAKKVLKEEWNRIKDEI